MEIDARAGDQIRTDTTAACHGPPNRTDQRHIPVHGMSLRETERGVVPDAALMQRKEKSRDLAAYHPTEPSTLTVVVNGTPAPNVTPFKAVLSRACSDQPPNIYGPAGGDCAWAEVLNTITAAPAQNSCRVTCE